MANNKMLDIASKNISKILKLSTQTLTVARCNVCNKEMTLTEFIGEFNTRCYTIAKCLKCGENYLLVLENFVKTKKEGLK